MVAICNRVAVINSDFLGIPRNFGSMRLSAFILNLLVLIMILAPCRDHQALSGDSSRTQVFHAAAQQQGQADDDCSPLCTCSCCGAVSLFFSSPQAGMIIPVSAVKKYRAYNAPFYFVERSSVWQPPRVG